MLIIVTNLKKRFGNRIDVYELRGATESEAFEAFSAVVEIYADDRDRYNITLQHFGVEDLEAWIQANVQPSGWWERLVGRVGATIYTLDKAAP